MSMAEGEHIDLQIKGLSLIDDDASENDDFLFTLSPSPLRPTDNHKDLNTELSRTEYVQEEKDIVDKGNQTDMFPELHVSVEPERSRRKGNINLRKSLAWDAAFFTDAGVLDPEELSTMVKGAEKNTLPMIDEDVDKSTDTLSTLESDNVPLEHLEAELFADIRASIQRSNKTSGSRKETSPEEDPASKKADAASRNVPKPKLPPRRITGTNTLGMSKGQQKLTEGIQGSRKGLKPDIPRATKSVTKSGDLTSSSAKLPKMILKANPIPAPMAKRASFSANQIKIDHDNTKTNTVSGKGMQLSKTFDSSNATKVLPKPTLSSKPASMRISAATKTQSSRSSSDSTTGSTGSTSSDKAGKPALPVARRKVVTKQPVSQPSSGSTLKTPSKAPSKSKVSTGNSAVSAYIMSSKIINSGISPASSISEWSSVSAASSSCSNLNGRSNKSRASFDTSSCRSSESVVTSLDITNWSSSQISEKPNQVTSPKENPMNVPTNPLMRPSGLRMPSPKIGFFDGAKSVRTPNGSSMHCHPKQSTPMPKIGKATLCSPSGRSDMKSNKVTLLNAIDDPTDKQCFPSFAPEVHHKPKEETMEHALDDVLLDAVNYHGGDQDILKNEMCENGNVKVNLNDIKAIEEKTSYSFTKNTETMITSLEASRIPFADRNSGNGNFLDSSMDAVGRGGGWDGVISAPPEIDYRENKNL